MNAVLDRSAMPCAGVFTKPSEPRAIDRAAHIHRSLTARGWRVLADEHTSRYWGWELLPNAEVAQTADVMIVLGGDGTLIHSVSLLGARDIPVLAFNLGTLGFITEWSSGDIDNALDMVVRGGFESERRVKLRVSLWREGQCVKETYVINDAYVAKGRQARLVDMELRINGAFVTRYRADGLIVATPTGSTGYSLSAGGPIVYPTHRAMTVTPICPHTLTNRPIVVADDSHVTVILNSRNTDVLLNFDGQHAETMRFEDRVEVEIAPHHLTMIKSPRRDYFGMLRTKLKWG
ncbi:MAG: NAD kinase [Myxococcota bacterium]|nr:NAD kinase [Myxococcota bacterium]